MTLTHQGICAKKSIIFKSFRMEISILQHNFAVLKCTQNPRNCQKVIPHSGLMGREYTTEKKTWTMKKCHHHIKKPVAF